MKRMNTKCRANNIILCNDQRKRSNFTLLDLQDCGKISFTETQNDCQMFCLAQNSMRHKYLILVYVPQVREVFRFESLKRNVFAKRIIFCLLFGEKVTFHNMCNRGCTVELNKNRIVFPIEKNQQWNNRDYQLITKVQFICYFILLIARVTIYNK